MAHIQPVFVVIGGTAVAFLAARVVATVVDVIGRWRRNDWKV